MGRFRFELASVDDDADLRRVAETPMPGNISLVFRREPSYLDANCVLGPERQTIVCRDQRTREIVGLASRSVREVYVDGQPARVGYLSALRILPDARKGTLLARGYRYLHELHEADPKRPEFYLTTIAEGNQTAIQLLTSGRASLPTYRFLGRLFTLAIPVRSRPQAVAQQDELWKATEDDMEPLLCFLGSVGSRREFFPVYNKTDFVGRDRTFRNLHPEDIRLVKRNGTIVGAVGLWNQQGFRQTAIHSYHGVIGYVRPLYNQWTKWAGRIPLPNPGEHLRGGFAAFPAVRDDDPDTFRCLLRSMRNCGSDATQYVLIGLCDNDPLLPIARKASAAIYVTRIYAVSWDRLPEAMFKQPTKPYYLELGCL